MSTLEQQYTPAAFGEEYYEKVLSGGRGYRYDSPEQQEQLGFKWKEGALLGFVPASAFFVGCAKGFEVKCWQEGGVDSFGMDVSEWAITNAEPSIAHRVALYRCGEDFVKAGYGRAASECFDAVYAFDVLALIPGLARAIVISEMVRTAKRGILIRTTVQHDPTNTQEIHGVDGVPYHLEGFDYWRFAFCRNDKFKLQAAIFYDQPGYLQAVMAFTRR